MKRLVLAGGGHAHVHVLKTLAEGAWPDVEVTLVSPYDRQVYSGMLPGWIAGHYSIDACVIPLPPLARCAGAAFRRTRVNAIDVQARRLQLETGGSLEYDVLSIDTGPVAALSSVPGADRYALPVRPIEDFIVALSAIVRRLEAKRASGGRPSIVFVGAGAAGIELALALQYRHRDLDVEFTLVSAANTLPGSVGPRLARVLAARGVRVMTGMSASACEEGEVRLSSGEVLPADAIIVATGSAAAPWLRDSQLATDAGGFLLVNEHLQSTSHANVFAAGDCATMQHHPRPKSGVYAVRAGPPLAANLRCCLEGEPLQRYVPQKNSLYLISTGDQYAIGSWGPLTWQGAWVWRWKDRIDREFMGKYTVAEPPVAPGV